MRLLRTASKAAIQEQPIRNSGFLGQSQYGGKEYNKEHGGGVSHNSADVLIPASLAAYTRKDPTRFHPPLFPAIRSMLPNWRITYDGLIRIPAIKKHFKSVMLTHQYRCTYNVGAYETYSTWVDAGLGDNLGFHTECFRSSLSRPHLTPSLPSA